MIKYKRVVICEDCGRAYSAVDDCGFTCCDYAAAPKRIDELEQKLTTVREALQFVWYHEEGWVYARRGEAAWSSAEKALQLSQPHLEKAERELAEARADLDRIRGVPFERGPDGEPNGPDLGAFLDVEKERDQLRRESEQLKREPDSTYGIALGYKREADSLREEKLIRAALDSGGGEKKPEHRPDDESCPCKTCSNALIREQLAGTFNRR